MPKLKLNPSPTFKAKVSIPQAGAEAVDLEFTFRHRTRDELQAFLDESKTSAKVDAEAIMEMAVGWELADEFNAASINALLQNYIAAAGAIFDTYLDELVKGRRKN